MRAGLRSKFKPIAHFKFPAISLISRKGDVRGSSERRVIFGTVCIINCWNERLLLFSRKLSSNRQTRELFHSLIMHGPLKSFVYTAFFVMKHFEISSFVDSEGVLNIYGKNFRKLMAAFIARR